MSIELRGHQLLSHNAKRVEVDVKSITGQIVFTEKAHRYYRVTVDYCDGTVEGTKVFIAADMKIKGDNETTRN